MFAIMMFAIRMLCIIQSFSSCTDELSVIYLYSFEYVEAGIAIVAAPAYSTDTIYIHEK